MKKLMIAAVAMTMAVVANAYTYDWKTGGTALYVGNKTGDSTTLYASTTDPAWSANVYLFNARDYSQQTLLTALIDGTDWADIIAAKAKGGVMNNGTDGKMETASEEFSDAGTTYDVAGGGVKVDVYFAALVDDQVLISKTLSKTVQTTAGDPTHISFTMYSNGTKTLVESDTFDSSKTQWYAVPEPTSGLLLLLGVAGLALRRRRA